MPPYRSSDISPARSSGRHPVYLVRHGETESNRLKRYAGHSPEPLTRTGRQQIAAVASDLVDAGATTIRSSRIARAMESARILGDILRLPIVADARLDELTMGPWEGLLECEIARQYPVEWDTWNTRPHQLHLAGRESLDDVAARVMSIVEEISVRETAILVTHVAPIRIAAMSVLDVPLSQYKRLTIENAACVRADVQAGTAVRFPSGACIRRELGRRSNEYAHA